MRKMVLSVRNKCFLVTFSVCLLSSALCFRFPHTSHLQRNDLILKNRLYSESRLTATLPTKSTLQVSSLNPWRKPPVKPSGVQHTFKSEFRRWFATIASSAILLFKTMITKSQKFAEGVMSAEPSLPMQPYQSFLLWASIFMFTTLFYCAENAIGKISPWTAKQYAEEEGPKSPFTILDSAESVTRMFITVLLTTTALDIYNQTLFVTTMSALFPNVNIAFFAMTLTVIQLFFGELMPKAIAAKNAEPLVRWLVPPLHRLSLFLAPITGGLTWLSDALIWLLGMKSTEPASVSENMLRLVVDEAQRTESIQSGEGRMIKGVLDMQDKEVGKIMQPRVDVIAVSEEDTVEDILRVAKACKYSRIPVYRGSVDHIVGIVFSKDILDFIEADPTVPVTSGSAKSRNSHSSNKEWMKLTAHDLMEPTHYIPETMNCWNALQDMRKKRLHMSIVVDEYGGTAGLVTLEDILEQVVGEIYDEDDNEERVDATKNIYRGKDGSYKMKGFAILDDVCEALQIDLQDEEEKLGSSLLGEYTTIGGLLCSLHGRIPRSGTKIPFSNYIFTILKVEDNRRVHEVLAEPVKQKATDVLQKLSRRVNASSTASSSSSSSASAETVDNLSRDGLMSAQDEDFDMTSSGSNDTSSYYYSPGDEGDLDVSANIANTLDSETGNGDNESGDNHDNTPAVGSDGVGMPMSGVSFIDGEWVENSGKSA